MTIALLHRCSRPCSSLTYATTAIRWRGRAVTPAEPRRSRAAPARAPRGRDSERASTQIRGRSEGRVSSRGRPTRQPPRGLHRGAPTARSQPPDRAAVRIEPEQYRTVGACLAAARRRANLTQTEAAERLGRKQTFVSEIERGLRRVDVLEIVLISRALDADPFQLFAEVTRSAEARLKTQKPQRRPKGGRTTFGSLST